MSASPKIEDIINAIKESGYLMEQEVATFFENRGMYVHTNVAFEDQEEGKSREIDVSAFKQVVRDDDAKIVGLVDLLVECKNSTNPFVFIARPKNAGDKRARPEEFVFQFEYKSQKKLSDGTGMSREEPPFNHLGYDKVYPAHALPWKAVQFCRIDRKGSAWHANHGGLYDALFYPMAKAILAEKKRIPHWRQSGGWRYIWLIFPIVVTSGDLFLIDSSSDNHQPKPVDYVSFQRELKSGQIKGQFLIHFVRQSALETFMSEVVDPMAAHTVDLVRNRQAFLLESNLPWQD